MPFWGILSGYLVQRQVRHYNTVRPRQPELANLCRLVARGMAEVGPLIRDVVAEAKRICDTLRDEPNKLRGTVFAW